MHERPMGVHFFLIDKKRHKNMEEKKEKDKKGRRTESKFCLTVGHCLVQLGVPGGDISWDGC